MKGKGKGRKRVQGNYKAGKAYNVKNANLGTKRQFGKKPKRTTR